MWNSATYLRVEERRLTRLPAIGGGSRGFVGGLMAAKTAPGDKHPQPTGSTALAARFSKFAQATAVWTGQPATFLLAAAVVGVWIVTGPLFNYSDTWQLVINTGTTIVTFLMVFLIQNTQNRDTLAIQLKLSELVLAMKGAENKFASIEDLSDEELAELHDECRTRAEMTGQHLDQRRSGSASRPRAAAHRAKSARRTAKAVD
jgi:low affinity Fe/Cu permease